MSVTVAELPQYHDKEIKQIREDLSLTQKNFAFVLGVSPKTVEAWESERVEISENSFGSFLRTFPLKEYGSPVLLYNGQAKRNNVHVSVFNMPLLNVDLIQCADAVIKLRAEYLYNQKRYSEIQFHIRLFNVFYKFVHHFYLFFLLPCYICPNLYTTSAYRYYSKNNFKPYSKRTNARVHTLPHIFPHNSLHCTQVSLPEHVQVVQ